MKWLTFEIDGNLGFPERNLSDPRTSRLLTLNVFSSTKRLKSPEVVAEFSSRALDGAVQ